MHIRIHTNDRPYHCPFKDICKQSFKTKSQLSDHILKHTQVKNYRCVECKACFSRKSRLKIHLMIHKGEKPFQCNICNKRFREKSNYNFHIKKHLSKLNKNEKPNQYNFKGDDLVMGNNMNDFGLLQNISPYKSSEIYNITNAINNNENDFNNYLFDLNNNDNLINKIKESMIKLSNINNKNLNNQFNNNYQIFNQKSKRFNNQFYNLDKEDEINLPYDPLKDEFNYINNKNSLFFKNCSFEPNYNSKSENQYNDEYINMNKEEKNKFETNIDNNMNLADNNFINNNYNLNNDLINQNNGNIGFGIDNRVYNNYYQINLTYPFIPEYMRSKDNSNY